LIAYLLDQAGRGEDVKKAAAENDYIKFSDVHDGPFMDWMLTSGLTREEVAFIQVPYVREPDDGAQFEQRETVRVRRHLADVDTRPRKTWDKRLDLAVDRLMASQDAPSS
jgi:hypothetical protein